MKTLLLGAAMASLIVGAAKAETADTAKDVRCLVTYSYYLGTTKDEADKPGLSVGVFYYSGRIEGREPAFDLAPAFKRELLVMTEDDAEKEYARCSAVLTANATKVEAIGKALEAEAKP